MSEQNTPEQLNKKSSANPKVENSKHEVQHANDNLGENIGSVQVAEARNQLLNRERNDVEGVKPLTGAEPVAAVDAKAQREEMMRQAQVQQLRQETAALAQMRDQVAGKLEHTPEPNPAPTTALFAGTVALIGIGAEKFANATSLAGDALKKLVEGKDLGDLKDKIPQELVDQVNNNKHVIDQKTLAKAIPEFWKESNDVLKAMSGQADSIAKLVHGNLEGEKLTKEIGKIADKVFKENNQLDKEEIKNQIQERVTEFKTSKEALNSTKEQVANIVKTGIEDSKNIVVQGARTVHNFIDGLPGDNNTLKYTGLAIAAGVVGYGIYELANAHKKEERQELKGNVGKFTQAIQERQQAIEHLSGAGATR
jgi:hypothetical protein